MKKIYKEKTKQFPFCTEKKASTQNKLSEYMSKTKWKSYIPCDKQICDWTRKKKFLIHYSMLKFYVENGMVVKKVIKKCSFKQNRWLKPHVDFDTDK